MSDEVCIAVSDVTLWEEVDPSVLRRYPGRDERFVVSWLSGLICWRRIEDWLSVRVLLSELVPLTPIPPAWSNGIEPSGSDGPGGMVGEGCAMCRWLSSRLGVSTVVVDSITFCCTGCW